MLNGAVCLTDTNPYLDGILWTAKIAASFLTRKEELPDIVRSLLADPAKMEQITEAGLKTGLQNTWQGVWISLIRGSGGSKRRRITRYRERNPCNENSDM